MKTTQWFLMAVVGLTLSLSAFAADTNEVAAETQAQTGMSLLDFRAAGLGAFNSAGDTFTGIVNWVPGYRFSDSLAARLDLGASLFKGFGDTRFAVAEAGLLGAYSVMPRIELELGGGAQMWFDTDSVKPIAMGNVHYVFAQKCAGFLDRAFVGYTAMFGNVLTSQIRLGVGMSF